MYKPNLLVKSLLLTLTLVLVGHPLLIAAQPEAERPPDPVEALTASGDIYLTHIAQATGLGLQLATTLESLNATPVAQLPEASVSQARTTALQLAEHSAIALGAVDDLANSLQIISTSFPAALDVAAQAGAGLPDELRQDLVTKAGLTSGQVDTLQTEFQSTVTARLGVAANGLPAPLVQQLQITGFTQSQIDQVAQAVAARGLADTSLATRLAQFRASQDELANARTYALVIYVRLLGKQIAVRQAGGIAPRPVTDAELAELANDELRLLIHVAHLAELWGSDPSLEVGEGDWWFIERYATRMSERLEALILDSQNRGLVVELLLARQMQLLAVSARSGDATYAKAELDRLADLLAFRAGNAGFVAAQRGQTAGPLKVLARLAAAPQVREYAQWPVAGEAQALAVKEARAALEAAGVVDLAAGGAFEETNEDNNTLSLLFAVGLPFYDQLLVDVLQGALDVLAALTPENVFTWLRAILTGDTDNPILMVASMLFSLIPVIGVIPDIYSLVTDPSIFVKALSLLGIVGSLGDLLALIPGLQGVAGGSFLGDAASAVMKNLFRNADSVFRGVVNALKLSEAFDVIVDVLKVVIKLVGDALGHSLDEVIRVLTDLFTGGLKLWDDFVAFGKYAGRDLLLELGFDEGSFFVGGILRRLNQDLADDVIRSLDNIGDELAEAGVKLSDEAEDGLGDAVNVLGEQRTRQIFSQCVIGSVVSPHVRASKLAAGLAKPAINEGWCDEALEVYGSITNEAAKRGYGKILAEDANRILSDPLLAGKAERIGLLLDRIPAGKIWSSEATQSLAHFVGKDLDAAVGHIFENYGDELAERTFKIIKITSGTWTQTGIEGVTKMANRLSDDALVEAILRKQGRGEFGNQVFTWLNKVTDSSAARGEDFTRWSRSLSVEGNTYVGAIFEAKYAAETLVDEGIARIGPQTDGLLTTDFIMTDGRHIELKNWSTYSGDHVDAAYNQLRLNLGIDVDGNIVSPGRFGDVRYEYVFRGTESATVKRRLLEIAQQAVNAGRLSQANYDFLAQSIRFLGQAPIP